ncbi:hypothetical protein T484DRAFT_2926218, partial [Baffinella frigidus]
MEEASVEKAVGLSGASLMGRRLRIDFAAQTGQRANAPMRGPNQGGKAPSSYSPGGNAFTNKKPSGPKPPGCTTVFCGNLAFEADEGAVREAFGECGEVTEVRMGRDRETGKFRGFAHVQFSESAATDKAIAKSGSDVMGRQVWVDFAQDKTRDGSGDGGGSRQ